MRFFIETVTGRKGYKSFKSLDEYVDFMTYKGHLVKTLKEADLPYSDKPVKLPKVSKSKGWEEVTDFGDIDREAEKAQSVIASSSGSVMKDEANMEVSKSSEKADKPEMGLGAEKGDVEMVDFKEFKYEEPEMKSSESKAPKSNASKAEESKEEKSEGKKPSKDEDDKDNIEETLELSGEQLDEIKEPKKLISGNGTTNPWTYGLEYDYNANKSNVLKSLKNIANRAKDLKMTGDSQDDEKRYSFEFDDDGEEIWDEKVDPLLKEAEKGSRDLISIYKDLSKIFKENMTSEIVWQSMIDFLGFHEQWKPNWVDTKDWGKLADSCAAAAVLYNASRLYAKNKNKLNKKADKEIEEALRIAGVNLEEAFKDYLPRAGFIRDDDEDKSSQKMGIWGGQGTDDQFAKAKIIAKVKFANGDRLGRVTKDDLAHFDEYKEQYDEIYGSDYE